MNFSFSMELDNLSSKFKREIEENNQLHKKEIKNLNKKILIKGEDINY